MTPKILPHAPKLPFRKLSLKLSLGLSLGLAPVFLGSLAGCTQDPTPRQQAEAEGDAAAQSREADPDAESLPPLPISGGSMQADASFWEDDEPLGVATASYVRPADSSENGEPAAETSTQAMLLGEWEDEYQGKRHLTIREDGTATMVVELSGIAKALFAPRMQFEIDWTLAEGKLVLKMTSGEPKAKTKLAMKLYGEEATYEILGLEKGLMKLKDATGTTEYEWRRSVETPADNQP
jgi:hypothetical protein